LWTSGEYAETHQATCPVNPQACPIGFAGVWGTWVGYFPWQTVTAFTDVSVPFTDYANVMSLWGITSGCTTTTFCPNLQIPRWQFAIFLIRAMEGDPCPNNTACAGGFTYTAKPYFTDVPATDFSFPYVQKLRDLGITSGCTTTSFCPNDVIARWTAAVMIVRGKMKALFGDSFSYPTTAVFTDVAPASSMFPYVQKLFELGITTGCTTTQFCPNDPITRLQAAIFIVRAFLN
jgi:Fe2+ transport system protein FeoA